MTLKKRIEKLEKQAGDDVAVIIRAMEGEKFPEEDCFVYRKGGPIEIWHSPKWHACHCATKADNTATIPKT